MKSHIKTIFALHKPPGRTPRAIFLARVSVTVPWWVWIVAEGNGILRIIQLIQHNF